MKNLVKEPTCFKNPNNPSTIDLILTNSPKSFCKTKSLLIGLSDFHKIVMTIFKTTFPKAKPKEITYRDYKHFNKNVFNHELKENLSNIDRMSYLKFEDTFLVTLNKHAPIKKKIIRTNQALYETRTLRKARMRRTSLEKLYIKKKTPEAFSKYKKQKNYCSRLYKKERKKYFSNMNLSDVSDNKKFWKTVKPFMSDKGTIGSKINLVHNGNLISEDVEVAQELNDYFEKATNSLEINKNSYLLSDTGGLDDPVELAVKKYKCHPSVMLIKSKIKKQTELFDFLEATSLDVEREIKQLNPKKANTYKNIPTKILKQSSEICTDALTDLFNKIVREEEFPAKLKLADVTPIYKKDDPTNSKNYRPVSVLPVTSKIFERLLQKQLSSFIDKFLSPFLSGYRKGYSTQEALLSLIEKWKKSLDKKGFGGAILMDLSKAFDTINHELLLAKLEAYGLSKRALKLIHSYLTNRWQRTKINLSFSNWSELLLGVPQGSVLGPLLFNIYINDLFLLLEQTDISNYADDTTLHACDSNVKELLRRLEHDSKLAIEWFENNYMKLNPEKCHFMISGFKYETLFANVSENKICETSKQNLLGVYIDKELKFDYHLTELCKKAGRKLNALSRISYFLSQEKRRIVMKSFVETQFGYCPLVWMFRGRESNKKINKIHERALRIVYHDYLSSFEDLLKKDNSVTIHVRNIRMLAIEMYKNKQNISNESLSGLFEKRNVKYNLRSQSDFAMTNVNTVNFGIKSMSFFGPKIWNIIPKEIRDLENLEHFKNKIKKWIPDKCPCHICRNYIQNVGFIDVS